jgi:rhodanese-related sulfurtransferase
MEASVNPSRRFKDDIYEQFARIGKAVSSPKRLELLDLICQGPRTVEMLARESSLTVANTSRHLHVLRGAGLIEGHKDGLYVTYQIADLAVCEFFRSMRLLAEKRLADIERITRRFLNGREGLEAVDREKLIERVRRKSVTVIDVRPVEEFQAGHIPGAISVPLKELESRLAELPKDREIVAYCRGPYCVLAIQAVEALHAKGFRAMRLEYGVQDWRARGLNVAIGKEA